MSPLQCFHLEEDDDHQPTGDKTAITGEVEANSVKIIPVSKCPGGDAKSDSVIRLLEHS